MKSLFGISTTIVWAWVFWCVATFAQTESLHKYHPWFEKQMALIAQSDDANLSDEALSTIIEKRESLYNEALKNIMLDPDSIDDYIKNYDSRIFKLKKMMAVNKRRGNKEAVLRDEVQIASYRLLMIQNEMIRRIFNALKHAKDAKAFEAEVYKIFSESYEKIDALDKKARYKRWLKKKPKNRIQKAIVRNIKEFYALKEINLDILRYFSENSKRIFRLYQYTRYKFLRPVLYLDSYPPFAELNAVLKPYGLSSVKVLLILFVTLLVFFVRKVLLGAIESLLVRFRYIGPYAKEVLSDIRRPISIWMVIVNIQLIWYIYHDLSVSDIVERGFLVLHVGFVTYILFKALNSVARVKLEDIERSGKMTVKSELFNITVKIINFAVLILGVLFMLHFAGVDLTTVLSGLGIGGFAVALAARDSLSNFFGTLSILISDVFSQGDWIEVDGKEGNVVEIGLRMTTIRTFDNALIAVPNATLANKEVKNWSRRIVGRRIKMKISLTYDSPPEKLRKTVEEIREMLRAHPGIATEKTAYSDRKNKSPKLVSKEDELGVKRTLMVFTDALSDSSIDILIYAFTKSTVWQEWLRVKEEVIYNIMEIVERNGLRFAFPTITVDGIERKDDR